MVDNKNFICRKKIEQKKSIPSENFEKECSKTYISRVYPPYMGSSQNFGKGAGPPPSQKF
jgi:hypothetical protein